MVQQEPNLLLTLKHLAPSGVALSTEVQVRAAPPRPSIAAAGRGPPAQQQQVEPWGQPPMLHPAGGAGALPAPQALRGGPQEPDPVGQAADQERQGARPLPASLRNTKQQQQQQQQVRGLAISSG
jgi:hypothetical protein